MSATATLSRPAKKLGPKAQARAASLSAALSSLPEKLALSDLFPQCLATEEACTRLVALTPRELEVLEAMMSLGKNRQIAEKFKISSKTLDIHRANLTRKLELKPTQYWQCYLPGRLAELRGEVSFRRDNGN